MCGVVTRGLLASCFFFFFPYLVCLTCCVAVRVLFGCCAGLCFVSFCFVRLRFVSVFLLRAGVRNGAHLLGGVAMEITKVVDG